MVDLHAPQAEQLRKVTILFSWHLAEPLLDMMPELRMVIAWGHGLDQIAIDALRTRGIAFRRTNHAAHAVAEYVLTQIMLSEKRILFFDRHIRENGWTWEFRRQHPVGEVAGKTLLVLGAGSTGRATADLAERLGMHVLSKSLEGGGGTGPDESNRRALYGLLAVADYVSLHLPLTAGTRYLVDKDFLKSMRDTAVLINTSRGALVQTESLISALERGVIRGAVLDVVEGEPLGCPHEILQFGNVVVTPHNSGFTREARMRGVQAALEIVEHSRELRPDGERTRHRLPIGNEEEGPPASQQVGTDRAK